MGVFAAVEGDGHLHPLPSQVLDGDVADLIKSCWSGSFATSQCAGLYAWWSSIRSCAQTIIPRVAS